MNRYLLVVPAALALVCVAAPAHATDDVPPPYVLTAWTINTPGFDGSGDVWGGGGQTDPITLPTASTDLEQIKTSVPCGRWVQIDLYNNDDTTAALIAGGVLYGPSNPAESPATDVSPWYISSWYSGDCAPEPEDKPYTASGSDFGCELTTNWSEEGFYAKSFDAVANVWTFAETPTVTAQTSSTTPTSAEDQAANNCELLARTGFEPWMPQVGLGALAAILIGALCLMWPAFKRAL